MSVDVRNGGAGRHILPWAGLFLSLLLNHHSLLTDFNLVPGDRGDTRLVIFTLEHWFNVFRGQESFYLLRIFHPDPLALGYADGLFLFGIPFAALRATGIDPFTAYQLLLVLLTVLGYCGWLWLLQRGPRLDVGFAVLGAVLLSSLNSLQFQADIGKLSAIHLYPVLLGLLCQPCMQVVRSRWKAVLSLTVFGGGLGLLFFTSYYPAWFFLFGLAIFALLALAAYLLADGWRRSLATALSWLKMHWLEIAAGLGSFAIALIPFSVTYAPLIASSAQRSLGLALEFSPTFLDLINVSRHNLIWTPVLLGLGYPFGNREVQMGSPILVLIVCCAVLIALAARLRRVGFRQLAGRHRLSLLLAATALMILLLSVKFHSYSLWSLVHSMVPGASALRAVGRILMIVDMIVIAIAVFGLQDLFTFLCREPGRRMQSLVPAFGLLGILLVIEQGNTMQYRLDKAEQLRLMARFRSPPADCRAFYLDNVPDDDQPFGYYQLDAMMISMGVDLPTVNGYSGIEPHQAFSMAPRGIEYKYRVLDWLVRRGAMEGICELDYQTAAFRVADVQAEHTRYAGLYRDSVLDTFSILRAAAEHFLSEGNAYSDLYPQYLEEHGYLDPAYGYAAGTRYKWLQDRYWLGERACPADTCFGIGVVGRYADLKPILDKYAAEARRIYFPEPQEWQPGAEPAQDADGQLLLIFSGTGAGE